MLRSMLYRMLRGSRGSGMNAPAITLRPTRPEDMSFLFNVYASTRLEELAPWGWSIEQQTAFLTQQFNAQDHHYHTHYTDAAFDVIFVDDRPAGRLYIARDETQIVIIDIALLPAYRNAGIGSRLLRDLLVQAADSGKVVDLHVEKFNPALRLYQRLGFRPIEDRGVYWFMEWAPSTNN
jgi:ribosomal protein S18 acetylase RimI-like enzyme